jgi:predicted DNA-binding transcriptional regulator AlpA
MRETLNGHGAPTLLLRPADAAKALAISPKTLWALSQPRGPLPVVRIGERSVRYSVAALQRWIAQQQVEASDQNEHRGDGARLAPATGYSPNRARSDSAALHATKNAR